MSDLNDRRQGTLRAPVAGSFDRDMKSEEIICPKCNTTGTCEIVPRLNHFNLIAFLAGGIVLSLLWTGSRPTNLKCTACKHRFSRRTRRAQVALVILWILIASIGLGLLALTTLPE
jgi:hypothetical protein